MNPQNNFQGEIKEVSPQDALRDTVTMIVSGYLKNNLDKNNNPSSKHFAKGLKESIESGIRLKNPNSKDAKVNAFLKYINKEESSHNNKLEDEEGQLQPHTKNHSSLGGLTHEIAEDYAIDIKDNKKRDYLAEAVFQSEIAILVKRGQGGDIEAQGLNSWDNLDEEQKEKYRHNVEEKREEQIRGIERWITYIASDEAMYPSWYKYFVITSLRSMGVEQFELGTYTYGGRNEKTLFRFPTLNPAVLAKVYDRMLSAYTEENIKKPTPSKYEIQDAARTNIDEAEKLFLEKYAKEANFTQLYAYELSKYKEATLESKRSSEGIWIKYKQQEEGSRALTEEAKKLSASLENKGTEWCTEQTSFSETQLAGGDFYVYYTREDFDKDTYGIPLEDMNEEEKKRVCTMPRIAIRMNDGKIDELRGIVGGQEQDLEPEMLDIARDKCRGNEEKGEEPLGGKEEYEKKAEDMKYLLNLIEKQNKGTVFTREDLLFLYEINGEIEGFGHNRDPRIYEIQKRRNREEDIVNMCNCSPEEVVYDFIDINEKTKVFVETEWKRNAYDDVAVVKFFDFRIEANQKKLLQLLELAQRIKENGSPARPDISMLGGIVTCSFDREQVKDRETAFRSFEKADSTPPWIWPEWNNAKFITPEGNSFETIVLSYNKDPNIRKSSDEIVKDMDKLGLRPLTLEEMTIVGIAHPEFTKTRDKYFVGLTKYALDGSSCVPCLDWDGVRRSLSGSGWRDGWSESRRFLCARK